MLLEFALPKSNLRLNSIRTFIVTEQSPYPVPNQSNLMEKWCTKAVWSPTSLLCYCSWCSVVEPAKVVPLCKLQDCISYIHWSHQTGPLDFHWQLDWNDVLQSDDIEKASNIMMTRVSETKKEFCKNYTCVKKNI